MFNSKITKMKTKILSFLFVLSAALLISTSAFAQPTVTTVATSDSYANVGATITYTIGTGGITGFVWAIRAESGNTGTATITASTSNAQSVTWTNAKSADIYYLDAYYVDANGCYSEMLTYKITIRNAVLCIATANETLNGKDASAPDVTQTCSLLQSGTTGNASSAYGGDVSTFFLTIKDGLPTTTYTVTYSVDGNDQATVSMTTDATGNDTKEITVTTTNFASSFLNSTTSSITVTVAAESMTASSNPQVITSACSYDITVNATPAIAF